MLGYVYLVINDTEWSDIWNNDVQYMLVWYDLICYDTIKRMLCNDIFQYIWIDVVCYLVCNTWFM